MRDRPDRLDCEHVFRKLDDYLDRELTPHETGLVREHLEVCEVCAAEYRFEKSVLANVREKLRHIAAPPDLLSRITRRIAEAEPEDGGR